MGFASGIASGQKTGFRSNNNSAGTTPAYDWMNYTEGLKQIIDRLKACVIENRNAIEVINQHDSPETLHYLDPPYLKNTRWKKQKTRVYKFEMADDEHEMLLKSLLDVKGMVILSGYDNELYNDMLPDWKKSQKAFLADGIPGQRERIETLWISPNTPLLQHKLF
jgi:DNA adenine methylase